MKAARLLTAFPLLLLGACAVPSAPRPRPAEPPSAAGPTSPHAVISTEKGDIVVRLLGDPVAGPAGAFAELAASATGYANVGFYRAVPGFILQGGDREDGPAPAPRAFSAGPTGRRFDKPGMVGFTDPAARGSFFITLMPAPWLDADHAPFGEVVQGMGLVEKAAASPEEPYDAQGRRIDRLRRPLLIRKISIEQR